MPESNPPLASKAAHITLSSGIYRFQYNPRLELAENVRFDAPDKNPRIDTEPRTERSGVSGSANRGFMSLLRCAACVALMEFCRRRQVCHAGEKMFCPVARVPKRVPATICRQNRRMISGYASRAWPCRSTELAVSATMTCIPPLFVHALGLPSTSLLAFR